MGMEYIIFYIGILRKFTWRAHSTSWRSCALYEERRSFLNTTYPLEQFFQMQLVTLSFKFGGGGRRRALCSRFNNGPKLTSSLSDSVYLGADDFVGSTWGRVIVVWNRVLLGHQRVLIFLVLCIQSWYRLVEFGRSYFLVMSWVLVVIWGFVYEEKFVG
jgi:hypothetical protein